MESSQLSLPRSRRLLYLYFFLKASKNFYPVKLGIQKFDMVYLHLMGLIKWQMTYPTMELLYLRVFKGYLVLYEYA